MRRFLNTKIWLHLPVLAVIRCTAQMNYLSAKRSFRDVGDCEASEQRCTC
jgi:hypothetical protein